MKTIYVHENGLPLTPAEIELLKQEKELKKEIRADKTAILVKIWLLLLLTIVVFAGLVFAFLEYQQTQQIIDTGAKWLNNR